MNFVSLFSGIGGFDLGFEDAGMECLAQVEIDDAARSVLDRRFPNAKKFKDVREFGHGQFKRGAVDLVCGGFPCQDVSVAGKRAGLAGERSGLWYEFARVIDELEPGWVIIENVPGLLSSCGCPTCGAVRRILGIHAYLRRKRKIHQLCPVCAAGKTMLGSHKGRDFAKIVQWLAGRGYGVSWRILDAQYFGVPQRRRRVFIVGSLGSGRSAEVLFESEGLPGDTQESREPGKEVAYSLRADPSHSGDKGDGGINTTLISFDWSNGSKSKRTQIVRSGDYAQVRANGVDAISYPLTAHPTAHLEPSQETFIVEQNNVASTPDMISLRSNPAQPVIFQQNARDEVRLTNGDGQLAGALVAQAGMKQQNYVDDVAPTLETGYFEKRYSNQQFMAQSGDAFPVVGQGVRRLTPTECERLQGFPDRWTDGQSDSARYRQLGNAVARPQATWIGKRIVELGK